MPRRAILVKLRARPTNPDRIRAKNGEVGMEPLDDFVTICSVVSRVVAGRLAHCWAGSFERFRYSEALLQGIAFANEVVGQTPNSTIDITTEPTAFQST